MKANRDMFRKKKKKSPPENILYEKKLSEILQTEGK